MTTGLRLAVLIPAHNAVTYICDALNSVAAQSQRPEAILVVDDGSTDGTADAVRRWGLHQRVEVSLLHQDHGGAAAARNHGLRHVEADLVALLDADDLWLPHHLGRSKQAFEHHEGLVLCFADAEVFSQAGPERRSFLEGKSIQALEIDDSGGGLRLIRGSAYSSLLRGNFIPVSSTVVSKRALDKVGGYDETLINAADRDVNLRLSRVGRFAYYASIAARKRIHGHNLSLRPEADRQRLKVLQKMEKRTRELALSPEELQRTRAAIREQAWGLLYTASRRGLRAYVAAGAYLVKRGLIAGTMNPKHLLRALRFATVKGAALQPSPASADDGGTGQAPPKHLFLARGVGATGDSRRRAPSPEARPEVTGV